MKFWLNSKSRGSTLAEIVLSIAIILTLSAGSLYYLSKGGASHALEKDRQGLIAFLEEARSLTLASKNASVYGVHIDQYAAYLFKDTYVSGDPDNRILQFNSFVHVLDIDLSVGDEVIFEKLSGEAEVYGTITLALKSDPSVTKNIVVLETGVVQ